VNYLKETLYIGKALEVNGIWSG